MSPFMLGYFLWFELVQVFCMLTQTLWVYMHDQPIVPENVFHYQLVLPVSHPSSVIIPESLVSCLGLSTPLSPVLYTLSSCDLPCKSSSMVKRSFSARECLLRLVLYPNKRLIMEYKWGWLWESRVPTWKQEAESKVQWWAELSTSMGSLPGAQAIVWAELMVESRVFTWRGGGKWTIRMDGVSVLNLEPLSEYKARRTGHAWASISF